MKSIQTTLKELHTFLILWMTQSFSALGSSMTSFALVVWSYQQQGSALTTSLLSICSYAPYVLLSVFAGALSDRWDKKATMLVSDTFAALCTLTVLILLQTGRLEIWFLYIINALNGLMNTVQQPASDVAVSLLTPQKHYQKVSGLRSFSNSLITILTPVFATALLAYTSIQGVILFDLGTFIVAFVTLFFFHSDSAARQGRYPQRSSAARRAGRASIFEGKPGDSASDPVSRRYQFYRFRIQCRFACHDAVQAGRGRIRVGPGQHLFRPCDTGWKRPCLRHAATQKPGARHLQFPASGHEHGEFFPRLRAQYARLVFRRDPRVDLHSIHERQYGRPLPHQNSH